MGADHSTEERIKPSSIFPLRIVARRQLGPCLHVSRPYIRRQVNEKRLFVMAVTSESAFFVIGVTSPVQQLR
jgi:hypothetical protein